MHCYSGVKFSHFLLRICVGKSPYILFGTRGLFGYAVEKIMYIQAERGFAAWAVFVGRTVVFVRGKGKGA